MTTEESKVKSPWNPIRLSALSMAEVTTGWVKLVAEVSMVAIGKETMATRVGDGVGVGVGIGVGVGVGVGTIVAVAVAVGVAVAVAVGVGEGVGVPVGGRSSVIVVAVAALPRKGSP